MQEVVMPWISYRIKPDGVRRQVLPFSILSSRKNLRLEASTRRFFTEVHKSIISYAFLPGPWVNLSPQKQKT
jgi:hypothetical protein